MRVFGFFQCREDIPSSFHIQSIFLIQHSKRLSAPCARRLSALDDTHLQCPQSAYQFDHYDKSEKVSTSNKCEGKRLNILGKTCGFPTGKDVLDEGKRCASVNLPITNLSTHELVCCSKLSPTSSFVQSASKASSKVNSCCSTYFVRSTLTLRHTVNTSFHTYIIRAMVNSLWLVDANSTPAINIGNICLICLDFLFVQRSLAYTHSNTVAEV